MVWGCLCITLMLAGFSPEAAGVESVLAGLRESITDDDTLLTAACSLFDGLLTTFEMRSGHDEQNGVADAGRGKR
jgi:hypothetical protein